jgi:hypothetical protein
LRYSLANENSIDLVLFLNGLPVATAELKTDFTKGIQDAVDQNRFDRHPTPKGQRPEPGPLDRGIPRSSRDWQCFCEISRSKSQLQIASCSPSSTTRFEGKQ